KATTAVALARLEAASRVFHADIDDESHGAFYQAAANGIALLLEVVDHCLSNRLGFGDSGWPPPQAEAPLPLEDASFLNASAPVHARQARAAEATPLTLALRQALRAGCRPAWRARTAAWILRVPLGPV